MDSIFSGCEVADTARMRCNKGELDDLLKTDRMQNNIDDLQRVNHEEGYSLIIFQEQNEEKLANSLVTMATEIHLMKDSSNAITLEKGPHRKRLITYEGAQPKLNMAEFWHTNLKFPANGSSVLCFNGGTDNAHKYTMVMKSDQQQGKWKWTEHEIYSYQTLSPNFTFLMEGMPRSGIFVKFTSLLPVLPLPLRMARSVPRPEKTVGVEVFDVEKGRWAVESDIPIDALPHSAFELKHVFSWNGKIYVVFVGDSDRGQPDFGSWVMEHLAMDRLVFRVFRFEISETGQSPANSFHCRWVQEPDEAESSSTGSSLVAPVEDEASYNDSKATKWLTSFLIPYIYARSQLSAIFDNVQLISTSDHNDLFIMRRETREGGALLVELWLKKEMWRARALRLKPPCIGKPTIVSFCMWRMDEEQCFQDCILIVGKLRGVDEGVWWIIKRQGPSAVLVNQGMLLDINDGTRFSLVKSLQP